MTVPLAVAPAATHAVIFHSTSDPDFNTTAPTGTLASSGWQYQFHLSEYLGTPVGPRHYLTAAHTGAGEGWGFNYNGVAYTTTKAVATYGDLRLFEVDNTFHSYAPLYDLAPESEDGKQVVVIGRGTQRGSEIRVGGILKGWHWGTIDGVQRWGTNHVAGFADDGALMRIDFDAGAGATEAVLSDKDSGGAMFIKVGEEWRLAGINLGVTGPYSIPPDTTQFVAALFDTSGMINHQTNPSTPGVGPSGAYASTVAPHATDIKTFLNLPPTWKTNGNGSWSASANWANGGVPDSVGATADFRTVISAPRTVTYSGTVTVGTLNFDSAHSYSIVPSISSSQLHLNVSSGSATVNVASGNHGIGGLHLDDPTTFNVISPASTLTVGLSSAAGKAIVKQGQGTLAVNRLISGPVAVLQGRVTVNSNGTSAATSKVGGLSVATAGAGAKFDLTNNDLVVTNGAIGTASGGTYSGLSGLIQQARAGGSWTGPGLTSSTAAAGAAGLTTLGIARAGDILSFGGGPTATWSGQTVSANDALIAYTYAGDANLDGVISGDDYTAIDFNIQVAGASGYANGDFNFDGIISGDDYTLIDFNILAQGAPLIVSGVEAVALTGVSAVPEPASLSLIALASVALLARRRRRAH